MPLFWHYHMVSTVCPVELGVCPCSEIKTTENVLPSWEVGGWSLQSCSTGVGLGLSESLEWSVNKETNGGLRKGKKKRMRGFILWSNYPIMNALKASHTGLSPSMKKGASSTLRAWGWGPEVLAGMGMEETPGFNTAHLQSQAPGKGALGRYPRQVVPDFSWFQPFACDGLAASSLKTKAAVTFNIFFLND